MADTSTVTIDGVPLEVEFTYTPAERGPRNSFGAPEGPDYNAEVDIEEIRLEGWEILSLMADDKIAKVRDKILRGEI